LFYTTISDGHKVLLCFQTHMSLNMLQSLENFNIQANILGNYVRDEDICTQVYYSFIDTTWNFEDKFIYPNYVAKSICRFLVQIWC
jgi:hypothetical protein